MNLKLLLINPKGVNNAFCDGLENRKTLLFFFKMFKDHKMNAPTHPPLLPRRQFLKKVTYNALLGFLMMFMSLLIGMIGYHHFEKLDWVDAYVNAAMILSGMGPVNDLKTEGGKIFAGSYALFSGIIFLFIMAIILAPAFHRFFHKLHIEDTIKK